MVAATSNAYEAAPTAALRYRPFTNAEVEASANSIERQLLGSFDLGFQATLRLNFPHDRLREMAHAARTAGRNRHTTLKLGLLLQSLGELAQTLMKHL